ncbi:MAG: aspartate aminotransferase family protein [Candidatus Aureabacteria bacterium]|nr:aspartate aminotransferase family protein [Candidatus Auribacterota bacterium]
MKSKKPSTARGDATIESYARYVIPSYGRSPLVIVRGKGSWLWDSEGKKYLDFFPGYAVSGLGHCHPKIVRAIKRQAEQLIHLPNIYYNPLQGKLAELIVTHSFPGKCFFCNSGAEANEAAMKLVRKSGHGRGRYEIVSMLESFHGRTIATITATGQKKYQEGFGPLLPGVVHVPFGDIGALGRAVNEKTCAVMLEPIQGEGGIKVARPEYFVAVRRLCDSKGILLIMDEVQTGMGRTGEYFAYQRYGIRPDIMTLAKTLGGGVAIGAMVAGSRYADLLQPGTHASTFGGNPLACAAAIATFAAIEEEGIIKNVRRLGNYLRTQAVRLSARFPFVREVRGEGFMLGMHLAIDGKMVVAECLKRGMLTNSTGDNVLRLMPAMTVKKQEIDRAMSIVGDVFDVVAKRNVSSGV